MGTSNNSYMLVVSVSNDDPYSGMMSRDRDFNTFPIPVDEETANFEKEKLYDFVLKKVKALAEYSRVRGIEIEAVFVITNSTSIRKV